MVPAVTTAAEMLTLAAENAAPIEFARIATLQALNRHGVGQFNPDRKDTHWGKRKLKRDPWKLSGFRSIRAPVGDADFKVFEDPDTALSWFRENDPGRCCFRIRSNGAVIAPRCGSRPTDSIH
jgi:hypothetical protein